MAVAGGRGWRRRHGWRAGLRPAQVAGLSQAVTPTPMFAPEGQFRGASWGGGARLWKGQREEAGEAGRDPRAPLFLRVERSVALVAAMCCLPQPRRGSAACVAPAERRSVIKKA